MDRFIMVSISQYRRTLLRLVFRKGRIQVDVDHCSFSMHSIHDALEYSNSSKNKMGKKKKRSRLEKKFLIDLALVHHTRCLVGDRCLSCLVSMYQCCSTMVFQTQRFQCWYCHLRVRVWWTDSIQYCASSHRSCGISMGTSYHWIHFVCLSWYRLMYRSTFE